MGFDTDSLRALRCHVTAQCDALTPELHSANPTKPGTTR